jgi:hypothetical protein
VSQSISDPTSKADEQSAMGFKGLFRRGGRSAGFTDVHNRLMSVYPDVGEIWYFAILCFAILCGCLGVGLWETYTTPAVVIYGIILCAFCVIPVGIIKAITGLEVTMNVLAEFIGKLYFPQRTRAARSEMMSSG